MSGKGNNDIFSSTKFDKARISKLYFGAEPGRVQYGDGTFSGFIQKNVRVKGFGQFPLRKSRVVGRVVTTICPTDNIMHDEFFKPKNTFTSLNCY